MDSNKYNVNLFVTRLINEKAATLLELETYYSFKDMIYLDEVLNIKEEAEYFKNKRLNDGR